MQMQLKVKRDTDPRTNKERARDLRKLGAHYNGATKIWTIDSDTSSDTRARLAVWRDYADYQGMTDEDIIRAALEVGQRYEEVVALPAEQERADQLLAAITSIINQRGVAGDPLTEAFDGLDKWLTAGGCLPTDWAQRT